MKLPILIRLDDDDQYPGIFLVFDEVTKFVASGYLIEAPSFDEAFGPYTAEYAVAFSKSCKTGEVSAFDQKWDGCQNIDFTRCWVHTCSDDCIDFMGAKLKAIRKHGLDLIEQAGGTVLK